MQTATVMAAVFVVVGWAGLDPVGCVAAQEMVLMVWVDAGVQNKSPDKGSVV